jgi:hypothetical protein
MKRSHPLDFFIFIKKTLFAAICVRALRETLQKWDLPKKISWGSSNLNRTFPSLERLVDLFKNPHSQSPDLIGVERKRRERWG